MSNYTFIMVDGVTRCRHWLVAAWCADCLLERNGKTLDLDGRRRASIKARRLAQARQRVERHLWATYARRAPIRENANPTLLSV